jgi:hypothetical protein
MTAQARMLGEELEELKERAGSSWTSEKQRAAEASAFQAPPPRQAGFYFPLSSAARPTSFLDEERACRASCSVPAKLFYQPAPAPAADADDMVALTGERYIDLPNAGSRLSGNQARALSRGPGPILAASRGTFRRRFS